MAKILFATIGSYGDVNPYLAVGKELQRRGHSCAIATADYYRKAVGDAGLAFVPMRPEVEPNDPELVKRLMDPRKGSELVVRQLVMPVIKETYADIAGAAADADLLVSHPLTYAVPILGEKTRKPWAATILAPIMFGSAYDVPVLSPAPWLAGVTRPLGIGFNTWFFRQLKKVSYSWSAPIRSFRKELGLSPGEDPLWEGQFSSRLNLALFSPLFAPPQPDWPANTRATGFPYLDDESAPNEPDLENFLRGGEAPLVFTLGSSAVMAAGDFYQQAAIVAKRLKRRAVLVAGPQTETLSATIPKSIKAVRWASYPGLFAKAAAVVHSGGIGTTAQALRAGVPQIVVPFSHDQFDNGAHAERLGVGAVLYRSRVSANRLEEKLNALLQNPLYAVRAREVGAKIKAEDGVAAACDALESIW